MDCMMDRLTHPEPKLTGRDEATTPETTEPKTELKMLSMVLVA